MFRLIKKSLFVLKNYGLKIFLIKVINWLLKRPINLLISFKLRLNEKKAKQNSELVIKELERFNSSKPEEIFDFAWKFFGGLIRPMQLREEFVELLKIFKELDPKYIMEIGTSNGGTLFSFCKLAREDAIVLSLDLPAGPFGGGYPEWKMPIYQAFKKKDQKLYLLREDSHQKETLEKVKGIIGDNQLDFLFIDGDHTYEGVKEDFEMYGSLVKKGGVIAFYDIVFHRFELVVKVDVFWNEIKSDFRFKEIVKNNNQNWAGIGIIYV